jgi:Skp family chaperone for outer membrane proteins
MKKLSLLSIIGVSALLLASCGQNSNVGVVDFDQLARSPELAMLAQSVAPSAADQKSVGDAYKAFQMSQAAVQSNKDASKTAALQQAMTAAKANVDKMVLQMQQDKQQSLQADVQSAVSSVAQSKGISTVYVKQVVLYGDTTDITQDVIAALGKQVSATTDASTNATAPAKN